MPNPNYKNLLDTLDALTDAAEQSKAVDASTVEVKASRAATSYLNLLRSEGFPLTMPDGYEAFTRQVMALGPAGFDRSEGDALATTLGSLLSVDPQYAPDAFNSVRERAEAVLARWKNTRPAGGTGARGPRVAKTVADPNNKGDVWNIGLSTVKVTMSYPEGAKIDKRPTFSHRYKSSLSNEIALRVKELVGANMPARSGFRDVDPAAGRAWADAWEAWKNAHKEGKDYAPASFTIHTDKGDFGVTLEPVKMAQAGAQAA